MVYFYKTKSEYINGYNGNGKQWPALNKLKNYFKSLGFIKTTGDEVSFNFLIQRCIEKNVGGTIGLVDIRLQCLKIIRNVHACKYPISCSLH